MSIKSFSMQRLSIMFWIFSDKHKNCSPKLLSFNVKGCPQLERNGLKQKKRNRKVTRCREYWQWLIDSKTIRRFPEVNVFCLPFKQTGGVLPSETHIFYLSKRRPGSGKVSPKNTERHGKVSPVSRTIRNSSVHLMLLKTIYLPVKNQISGAIHGCQVNCRNCLGMFGAKNFHIALVFGLVQERGFNVLLLPRIAATRLNQPVLLPGATNFVVPFSNLLHAYLFMTSRVQAVE